MIGLLYEEDAGRPVVRLRRVDGCVVFVSPRGVGPVGFVGFRSGAIVSDLFAGASTVSRRREERIFRKVVSFDATKSAVDLGTYLSFPEATRLERELRTAIDALRHEE